MPSLEDLGTRQIVSGTPASDDIVAFFDVSEFGNNPVKKTTVASLAGVHTHVSADITDSTDDGVANVGKLLRTSRVGLGAATITLGTVTLKEVAYQTSLTYDGIAGAVAGVTEFIGFFPGGPAQGFSAPIGTFPILPRYENSTAAAAAVSVGDVWWDTTLNKARVRLT